MSYEDQFTPWKENELVISDWEKLTALAEGFFHEAVKSCVTMELDIKDDLKCAAIYCRAKRAGC